MLLILKQKTTTSYLAAKRVKIYIFSKNKQTIFDFKPWFFLCEIALFNHQFRSFFHTNLGMYSWLEYRKIFWEGTFSNTL